MAKSETYRKRFFFWLDVLDENEAIIARHINQLKAKRLYTKTLRDGIRLIVDLRSGKLDVLFELFPDLKTQFKQEDDVENQLAEIKQMLRSVPSSEKRQTTIIGKKPSGKKGGIKRNKVKTSAETKMKNLLGSI